VPGQHDEWLAELRAIEGDQGHRQAAAARVRRRSAHEPLRLSPEASPTRIEDDTIVVGDGGNIVSVTAKVVDRKLPGTWLDPGPFGCLGVGAPFALAAKLLYPERKVLVVQGDGSFGLNGFDYDTCLRFGCPVTAVVGNDAAWGQIWLPQKALYGARSRGGHAACRATRYDKVVEAMGGVGYHVERAGRPWPTIKQAMAMETVTCVNVHDRSAGTWKRAGGGAYAI
jgi:acetolactate synthase-1/2/3 large subunit